MRCSLACAAIVGVFASATAHADNKPTVAEPPIEYGIGLRARAVRVDKPLLELFMARAAGTAKGQGLGFELARRHGTLELQLGAEFDYILPKEGVYIDTGSDVAPPPSGGGDEADFLLAPEHNGHKRLGWATIEFTFLNHAELTDYLAVRYGGGVGVGIVRGEVGRYDIICNGATNENPEPGCTPPIEPFNGAGTFSDDGGKITPGTIAKYDIPKYFPVVNAIIGLQLRPFKKMTINVEGGIRTIPFFGASTSFFF